MDIKLDARHAIRGRTLLCHVSTRDIKLGSHVTVNGDAVSTYINKLDKIVFEFDDAALARLAKENHIEPAGELVFYLRDNMLQSLAATQDLSGATSCLIPLFWIDGFVEMADEEKPQKKQKGLFDSDD